ncbi:biosynthetic arginine decarboxylase [Methylococcus sp. EFPC2]|uniref:biosynthetic arginine decarboxylase n=1 Tax=Methylococcus sp. EFPC2 TaxID=2812648 RepID=UPI0019687F97|nr:biosynthetic arginine decarboxylase [Methylococcus sp. EFPC2]QSA95736.1 biosynthetic arginine decarboxylase [Methylococcus sp. EFPC2]
MTASAWDLQRARETYSIEHWGDGYFNINGQGHVVAYPNRTPVAGAVDLHEVARAIRKEGLSLPVLVRFTDILKNRVGLLHQAFAKAREDLAYGGTYTPVYPIKVNQQRGVIESLLNNGHGPLGLEAGSKSELLAILALAKSGVIVCNGYKDRAYIRLALIGRRLGLDVFIVVEKLSELELILAESKALGIPPQLGLRVRLSCISAGKWQNSGGEKSKFGLHANEILKLIDVLRAHDGLEWLQLMHFHMGSQVANINDVKTAMREAGRYYAELRKLGAPILYTDVGGGLGVDYEGTHSSSDCSINYSIDEYAHAIVRALHEIADEHALPHPNVITESGRAMSAHHAVLITNIIDVESTPEQWPEPTQSQSQPLKDLCALLRRLPDEPPLALYLDAQFDLAEARSMYVRGTLNLQELAEAERINAAICHAVRQRLDVRLRAHREVLDELNERLADKVFCNFSVFQSMPDAWAIDQIFPVMPLQRLDEEPTRRAVLQDLTCDSDGQINAYLDRQSIETTLPIHDVKPSEGYLLGIFMVGAYQEILGDMHNLFGDTHSVNVELDGQGGYRLAQPMRGDGADDLLRYVHIDPEELKRAYLKKLLDAGLAPGQRKLYESELIAGLSAYTYLEE